MSDLNEFRAQTRAWLETNAPQGIRGVRMSFAGGIWGGRNPRWPHPDAQAWMERMAERGWTAPTWPKAYGGGGLSRAEARVLQEEVRALRLPAPLVGLGLVMIGPTLLQYGSEAQKQEHIPRIIRGEIRWCQGYSEPGAGSDLASLSTKGVVDGQDLVVTGQKIWTSYANFSDWIFALVRTEPGSQRQAGVSFVLMDLQTPGVIVRPITLISGASSFCETFFDRARTPLANVVGDLHHGWAVAKALLGHERDVWGDSGGGAGDKVQETLAETARQRVGPASLDGTELREQIVRHEMEQRAFALTGQRFRDAMRAGQAPGPESSIFKYAGASLSKERQDLMMEISGLDGLLWDDGDDTGPSLVRTWLRSRANSIEGGTSETQLNIIAKRVLGLP